MRLCSIFIILAGMACSGFESIEHSLVEGSPEALGILSLVNADSTTFALLDDDVGLDSRAARNIIDFRAGSDAQLTTSDDQYFLSLADLDDIAYVGDRAFDKLLDYALNHGYVASNPSPEEAAILALVNSDITIALLDNDIGLDSRAASNIFSFRAGPDGLTATPDDRTFMSLQDLDDIPYVGQSALDKLLTYALDHGYGSPCVIFSEVIEGWGQYNKAFELFNCGTTAVQLDQTSACLVRNDDTECSSTATLGSHSLAPGETWVVCKTLGGTFNDPIDSLRSACDEEIPAVTNFNGDDRLLLLIDRDSNELLDDSDVALDQLGDLDFHPTDYPWQDVTLRRCNFTPFRGNGYYYTNQYFTRHSRGDASHFGVAPAADSTCQ